MSVLLNELAATAMGLEAGSRSLKERTSFVLNMYHIRDCHLFSTMRSREFERVIHRVEDGLRVTIMEVNSPYHLPIITIVGQAVQQVTQNMADFSMQIKRLGTSHEVPPPLSDLSSRNML